MNEVPNLDYLAAKYAQELIEKVLSQDGAKGESRRLVSSIDNTVTKALGVLQENGVYACFLYLFAKDNGKVVAEKMFELLRKLPLEGKNKDNCDNANDNTRLEKVVLPWIIENVTVDLERLLLVRQTLEQMLIYARYTAKARRK